MRSAKIRTPDSQAGDNGLAIERLLFVADAAVADVGELPREVRAVIEAAAEVYVVTPTLPGRLAWLADDVDGFRHIADERLDTVLGHMHSIGAHASGLAGRGSVFPVIEDAVAVFKPDHVLIALRSPEHANWQERRLIDHIKERFGLPLTTYAVDSQGHAPTADGPLLLCYDGSDAAARAVERAGALFPGRYALVVTVWKPTVNVSTIGRLGARDSMGTFVEDDRAAAVRAGRVADEGARLACEVGLNAEPAAVEGASPWAAILEMADRHDATIVMGSRGLSGMRSKLLGSVSSAVVHHTARPTLLVP